MDATGSRFLLVAFKGHDLEEETESFQEGGRWKELA